MQANVVVPVLVVLVLLGVGAVLLVAIRAPRTDRDWAADQAVPARVDLADDSVRIRDLRDFRHEPDGAFVEGYRDVTWALEDVRGVWFVLAPFAKRWRGLAHGFLSFELTGDRFVSISVEARREEGEPYSLLGGLARRFELTYVVGTEEDVVGLRAVRGDTLFVYPSRASPEQARTLFVDMLRRAERLHHEPEFYNTFFSNCMTNVRDHVNGLEGVHLPYGWGMLLPGYSDRLALDHGVLDSDLSIERARERFRVDVRARRALPGGLGEDAEPGAFSREIRDGTGAEDVP